MKKEAQANIELAKLDVRIAEKSSEILTGSVENVGRLIRERFALEEQRASFLKAISDFRYSMQAEQQAAEKAAEQAERKKQDAWLTEVEKEQRSCPYCSCAAKIVDLPKQPERGYGKIWATFYCCNPKLGECGTMFRIYYPETSVREPKEPSYQ